MNTEIWETIPDFEDYKISNFGDVKSLKFGKGKVLKKGIDGSGYYNLKLTKNGVCYTKKIHTLMAIVFLNHKPCGMELVVNHKDFNRLNNNLSNLEVITPRENANQKHLKSSSKYTGVYWDKSNKKWRASIYNNKKLIQLGRFINEYDAHLAYQNKLKEIEAITTAKELISKFDIKQEELFKN